jgi:hypothetical protein
MVLLIVYQLLLLFIFQHLILAQKTTQAGNDVSNTVPWIEICE